MTCRQAWLLEESKRQNELDVLMKIAPAIAEIDGGCSNCVGRFFEELAKCLGATRADLMPLAMRVQEISSTSMCLTVEECLEDVPAL